MKKYLFLILSLLMSCTELIDPPKNLVPKKTMSELVAQFALNDQINNYIPNTNIENATRTVLKQKKVSPTDFTESYKYYTASGELDAILTDAQKIILDKDPAAKAYIEKKLKENQNVPTFAR
ncbi:DUF4296 domain-containing protein [Kaistella palustris]|uniref:DUF4296 domain-containing protein n=1 Tax=Kaistella palustris TaxID=493376 RepID=UPI000485CC85|nr:DUF4296 domain-containing protein [Kaistella palustris]